MSNGTLLLVDDDRHILESMAHWLREQGFDVDTAADYPQALTRFDHNDYDVVICDIRLRDADGFDLLEHARRTKSHVAIILVTGYGTVDTAIDAIRAGAADFLTKPLIDEELLMAIERAMSQRAVLRENDQLKQQLDLKFGMDNIVGTDRRMRRVYEMIESVADTRATVLITGESGTGKSMIARAIHRRSGRRDKSYIEVACGALPENLLESELFGHVAGSFTGATTDKKGKFKLADGGTIFLDEIGTASPSMQVKLLRVLQELQFEQVGGTQTFDIDTRVILATNDDLARCVEQGTFRQDLYYRVNVINIELPPLRERISDIAVLANHFLAEVREETGKSMAGFSASAITAMQQYRWPGNVRELQNAVERAVLLGKGPLIEPHDLPSDMGATRQVNVSSVGTRTLKEALEEPERQIILEVLNGNNWNRNETADQLGINRTTLYKKMKRLGLEERRYGVPVNDA